MITYDASPMIIRSVVSFFSPLRVATYREFILTPEQKTEQAWVSFLQLLVAVLVLLPFTTFLTGLTIVFAFIHASMQYGIYHLLDYPIFVSVTIFIILTGLHQSYFTVAMTVNRLCTGIALMWASIEIFAYPERSYGLLDAKPQLTLVSVTLSVIKPAQY